MVIYPWQQTKHEQWSVLTISDSTHSSLPLPLPAVCPMLSVAATCLGDTANDPNEKQRQRVTGRKRGRLKLFYLSAEHPVFDTACKTYTYRTLTGQMDPGSGEDITNVN